MGKKKVHGDGTISCKGSKPICVSGDGDGNPTDYTDAIKITSLTIYDDAGNPEQTLRVKNVRISVSGDETTVRYELAQ